MHSSWAKKFVSTYRMLNPIRVGVFSVFFVPQLRVTCLHRRAPFADAVNISQLRRLWTLMSSFRQRKFVANWPIGWWNWTDFHLWFSSSTYRLWRKANCAVNRFFFGGGGELFLFCYIADRQNCVSGSTARRVQPRIESQQNYGWLFKQPNKSTFSSACAVFGLLLFRCAATIVPRVLLSESVHV